MRFGERAASGDPANWTPDSTMTAYAAAEYQANPKKLREAINNAQYRLEEVIKGRRFTGEAKETAIRRLVDWVMVLNLLGRKQGLEEMQNLDTTPLEALNQAGLLGQ